MPKLMIDGHEVDVPAGTNVLEAAKKVGIVIPHFCYHPALGSVGACRLCAMKFVEGPVKGVQVSCMVQAQDGMVVSTTDGEAARLRRMVIEWLMVNHPHDCPVCDEGGMCLLQDYTIAGGHSIRRYRGKKRVFADQYLGEFIKQEMNRCIHCYRCHRFYQDYAGGEDFGAMRISNKTFFGRSGDGWLESEFSGNLADICPTGVFTDKTFRFKARLWDLETAPSVCPHCSLGCNVIPAGRYRELVRVEARENLAVNGWFICDRGRFGYRHASRADRPYRPLVHSIETDYGPALKAAARLIGESVDKSGPGSVAFVGSVRVPLESNYALLRLARAVGSKNICYSIDPARDRKDRFAALKLGGLGRSLMDVGGSDFILAAGVDPVNEAPMLALMMRQAFRNGAEVTVIDPRPVKLPLPFTHVPTAPGALADALSENISGLKGAKRPTVVIGTDIGTHELIGRAADEVSRMKAGGMDCGLFYAMSGANSFGVALLAGDGPDFEDILDGILDGAIKTLVVCGSDPLGLYPDNERVRDAFASLESLIVMDCLPTETAKAAHVFMPSTVYAEESGSFVNQEGRAQGYRRAYVPGIPINVMGPKAHPPREFSPNVPGRSRESWILVDELARIIDTDLRPYGSVADVRADMAAEDPLWAGLSGLDADIEGALITIPPSFETRTPLKEKVSNLDAPGAPLMLIAVELTFGTEELSTYSDKTQLRSPAPYVLLNSVDAQRHGLAAGMAVELRCGETSLACELRTSEMSAQSVAIAPRLRGFPVAAMNGRTVTVAQVKND